MQFLLTAYDGTDEKAQERRLANREAHIKFSDELVAKKQMLFGVAMLDNDNKMIGSMVIYDFPSRIKPEEVSKKEPYVIGKVWQKIEIVPCKIGPSFTGLYSNWRL